MIQSPDANVAEAGRRVVARAGGPLASQLRWFGRLRWLAGVAVIVGAVLDWQAMHWYGRPWWMIGLGTVILLYNVLLWRLIGSGVMSPRGRLLGVAALQIVLDLTCLTLLMTWTGWGSSPLLLFFVFHMVFASLLLPRAMAYGGAAVAFALVAVALWLGGHWPTGRQERVLLVAWAVTLLLTVHLANRIVRGLRRQRRRLARKNRRIRRMTRQLRRHQQAMIQHEKMVAMGHMAAGVTHEIANPLASMDSLLQLMQRKPERIGEESLANLRQQLHRVHQIIQQMKAFAHPAEMQRQVLPLNEVVEQALQMVRFDKRLAQVQVVRNYDPEAGNLSLLPQALQQVVVNLVINALDAMADCPPGRGQLTIRTQRRDSWCLIEVGDSGCGIKPEHMPRLFEPFFTTKPVGQGTGLGLSISYSLVQKQGGSISVKSHEGKGATFTIRLPAEETAVGQGVGTGAAATSAATPRP